MKLIRLKVTDPKGFRSLQSGFEHHFRKAWQINEKDALAEFAPFVCAGPNGSGKSNLLEVLAAIFYQLEVLRIRRNFLPEILQDNDQDDTLSSFELDYLIKVPKDFISPAGPEWANVSVWKESGTTVRFIWNNQSEFETNKNEVFSGGYADILLPQYIIGYSSGENEILSLPFFKMRFVQYDEYYHALKEQLPYGGSPESRLIYLDNSFSQAILLSNLLYQTDETLAPFREEVGIESLNEFRIIIKRKFTVSADMASEFGGNNPSVKFDSENNSYLVDLVSLLEADEALQKEISEESEKEGSSSISAYGNFSPAITRLKRCATSWFEDHETDSLYLDYSVNQATKDAFKNNFNSALELFQALQVLLTLNLYSVSDKLKAELYQSNSLYVSETVPSLPSDERIMRIKHFWISKKDIKEPVLLKSLSDGEHQLLHTLGLCILFKNTNSLFLLDEPETHFNPQWRANFISRLRQSFSDKDRENHNQEILITTHTPFLISDSTPDKVLVFNKDKGTGEVAVSNPEYNTLGASINKITMATFDKRETIGGLAQSLLNAFKASSEQQETDKNQLIKDINNKLGDSVEKVLLIKTILDSMEGGD
ncbi:restriction system-associated AAA family ATPase [Pseudoalteromonas sp. APC 3691]|uniref:restriction system-associated AAA family ATPase n=1 Tax=Pseudoalteromonas sp. APC 3691 TaxID=3035173 RepID=UPI0025B43F76|nr:restriction system-associated AAA family ATPase [Pseudoalteromonas sp. APC 3691]MDN3390719.1 restriction system-associated AAA family ATPase [Pseudoalteromonas sp. APC 3691]